MTATSSLLLSRDYKESPPSAQLVGVLWVGGDVGGGGSEDNIPGERVVCHPPAACDQNLEYEFLATVTLMRWTRGSMRSLMMLMMILG